MADSFPTLASARYVPPGGYIGQLIQPKAPVLEGTPRIPCYIGKGSRLANSNNDAISRGYIIGSEIVDPNSVTGRGLLSFSGSSPHTATLPHNSNGDKNVARIYKASGNNEIPKSMWNFTESAGNEAEGYDQVVILDAAYNSSETYYIDYQSVDRRAVDVIPYNDIREVKSLSLQTSQEEYIEHTHFFLPSTITPAVRDSADNDIDSDATYNTYSEGFVGALRKLSGSADGLAVTGTPEYTGKYDRSYYMLVKTSSSTGFTALQTLVKALGVGLVAHMAEGASVHSAADATNTLTAPVATLLAAASSTYTAANIIAIVEDVRAKYEAHRVLLSSHSAADSVNTCATLATAVTTLGRAWRVAHLLRAAFESGGIAGAGTGHFNTTASVHGATPATTITAPTAAFDLHWYGQPGSPGWVNNSDAAENLVPPDFAYESTTISLTNAGVLAIDNANGVGALSGDFEVGEDDIPITTSLIDVDLIAHTDVWVLEANGPGIFELSDLYHNSNQYQYISEITHPVIDLANALRSAYEAHRVRLLDAGSGVVHGSGFGVVDTVNALVEPVATTLAEAYALLNDIKAKMNLHLALVTGSVHLAADSSNTITAAAATTIATAVALANEIRTDLTAHMASTVFHTNNDDVTSLTAAASGTGNFSYAADSQYTGAYNRKFKFIVTAVNGTTDVDLEWVSWGEYESTSVGCVMRGSESAVIDGETITIHSGVKLVVDLGASNFVVGETFDITVLAPRIYYRGRDDREYLIRVNSVVAYPSNAVEWSWYTNTPEGSFGTGVTSTYNAGSKDCAEMLADMVSVFVRNLGQTNSHSSSSHSSTGDKHEFAFVLNDTFDFSLKLRRQETIAKASFRHDPTGVITGVPNARYVELTYSVLTAAEDGGSTYGENGILHVKNAAGTELVYGQVTDTKLVYVTAAVYTALTSAGITVTYFTAGEEPAPGQTYYFSGKYLRPAEMYDTPLLLVGLEQAFTTLAPMETGNHLLMMANMAFKNDIQAVYVVQIRDVDEDGEFTTADFQRGLDASKTIESISDVIVLDGWTSLSNTLTNINQCADPLQNKLRLGWFGMPIDTPVGDPDTANTLVYTAKRTLQVYGDDQAHGTRILVGSTYGKLTITLDDGNTTQVTLDGSFIAGCLAAMTASFASPWEVLLRKTLVGGWDEIEVQTSARNLLLGAAGIMYFTDEGSGVYRIRESVTVDKSSDDFSEISAMTQKQHMKKVVVNAINSASIGYVAPSPAAAVANIKGTVVEAVQNEVALGNIGAFQDDSGNERKIDPDKDVIARRSSTSRTNYNVIYGYYLKYVTKRVFGLYAVDTNKLLSKTPGV